MLHQELEDLSFLVFDLFAINPDDPAVAVGLGCPDLDPVITALATFHGRWERLEPIDWHLAAGVSSKWLG